MKITPSTPRTYEFACHVAACRPPTSGGTGGSSNTSAGTVGGSKGYKQMKAREKYQSQLAQTNKFRKAQGWKPLGA